MIDQKFLFEQGRTEEDGERDRRKPRKEKIRDRNCSLHRTHEWIVVYFPNSWNVDFSQGDSARLLRCVQIVEDSGNRVSLYHKIVSLI